MNNIIDLNEYKSNKKAKNTLTIENTSSIREEWINELLDKNEAMVYKVKTQGELDLIKCLFEYIPTLIK
jgi:hypothetical protein